MGKFDGIMIFSDIDGTFIDDDRNTVPRNYPYDHPLIEHEKSFNPISYEKV